MDVIAWGPTWLTWKFGRQGGRQIEDDLECHSKNSGLESISKEESVRVFEQKGYKLSSALEKCNQAVIRALN